MTVSNFCLRILAVGLICIPFEGCAATVEIADDSRAFEPGQSVYIVADYDQIEDADDADVYGLTEKDAEAVESDADFIFEEIVVMDYSVPPELLSVVQVIRSQGTRVLFVGDGPIYHLFYGWVD